MYKWGVPMGVNKIKDQKKNRALFIKQFLERPGEVASIIPSSDELVSALIAGVNYKELNLVVEYGPGTGVITEALRPRLRKEAIYLAAEPNSAFRQHLSESGLEIELLADYAQNISERVLANHGQADLVVSGIPCSVIPVESLRSIFESTHKILRFGGEFRMFIYTHTFLMPKIHGMLQNLRGQFTSVNTQAVWLNLPPATVIKCIK